MLDSQNKTLRVISILILFLIMLPLVLVIITSFGNQDSISLPIHGFTFEWYKNVFAQPDFIAGFKMSLLVALIASLAALVVGIPAVYALTRFKLRHSSWLQSFFLSPALIPEIVIGFSLYQTAVITMKLPLLLSLIIGHFLLCVPYVIRLITASMLLLDPHIEEAAWICGSSPKKTFFAIVLPNIKTSIIAAFMMCFINSFNNIPISLFLNGPELNMLPTAILNYLQNNYDPTVSAISVMLMIFTALIMFVVEKVLGINKLTR
ncbi:ABC transporter permease [Loigolactobacillus coryniformis]|uniref:Spermidine/putrescine ABC transporter, permease protein n=1 Tax=Loigolactobacillus coryniformis subsp. coryniformis CECT 5711 TaxID=1185325 RepID=J2Z6V2_9LACO|nr:ABC transporter permease [Loigolactobacillus coryniformis]EJN56258.1 Spermidine/putrescine ABC transporter, permease protein [Loigolactobacillus coryniformis subsp. coryniformis CECT 5711]